MTDAPPAVVARGVSHRYGNTAALSDVDLEVPAGRIFGLLGPNGSGKSTLFRLLTTHHRLQAGQLSVLGHDVTTHPAAVRSRIGVVFQSPSLDGKLTVHENLKHHARLYGLAATWRQSADELLARFGLADRRGEYVERLSGGLARRVELAKALLHRPRLLLLDEPSTGLDPGARRDFWQRLEALRDDGISILLTTHLMDEAESCDCLAILDMGRVAAEGTPGELREAVGGAVITLRAGDVNPVAEALIDEFDVPPDSISVDEEGQRLRVEPADATSLLAELLGRFSDRIESATIARPTLEDVFHQRTGRSFWTADAAASFAAPTTAHDA